MASLFRSDTPDDEHPTEPLPLTSSRRVMPEPRIREPERPENEPTGEGSNTALKVSFGVLALVCAGLIAALVVSVMHTNSVNKDHRDELVTLRADHAEQISDIRADDAAAQADAVNAEIKRQKTQAARRIKAAVARQRRADARKLEAAVADARASGYSAGTNDGYSEGNADGYAEGSADGYDDGLYDGSDALDCSDDIDVWWLPAC